MQLECTHTDTAAVAVVTVEKIEEDIEAGEYVIKVTCDATDKAKRACADDFDGASKEFSHHFSLTVGTTCFQDAVFVFTGRRCQRNVL